MAKPVVIASLIIPFGYLVVNTLLQAWGADPAKAIVHRSGEITLWLLILVYLATPVQRILRFGYLVKFRRQVGVAMCVYGVIHVVLYLTAYLGWDIDALAKDITERPYIIVGGIGLLLAIPLALTSNNLSVKWLGHSWKLLHRLVYGIAPLAVLHIAMQVKVDFTESIIYGVLFALLFVLRSKKLQKRLSLIIN